MEKPELTVSEALRFSRHDYLNELQLILMYIDLGELPKAKETILRTTDVIAQLSKLSNLGLPATERWLSTFNWIYKAYETRLSCTIEPGIRKVEDTVLASYLDTVFSDMESSLDALTEYEAHIEVTASTNDWLIEIVVHGVLNEKDSLPEAENDFFVEETVMDNIWKLTIRGN